MPIDDDDDLDFNQEFSDEENAEFEKQYAEEQKKLRRHPLFVQANEILKILKLMIDSAGESDEESMYDSTLLESAMIIIPKLASGLTCNNYVIAMQSAAIIRDHAEYLRLSNHMLKERKGFDVHYVNLFREEMEKFRMLFKEWAAELHAMEVDYQDVEWGLFVK